MALPSPVFQFMGSKKPDIRPQPAGTSLYKYRYSCGIGPAVGLSGKQARLITSSPLSPHTITYRTISYLARKMLFRTVATSLLAGMGLWSTAFAQTQSIWGQCKISWTHWQPYWAKLNPPLQAADVTGLGPPRASTARPAISKTSITRSVSSRRAARMTKATTPRMVATTRVQTSPSIQLRLQLRPPRNPLQMGMMARR